MARSFVFGSILNAMKDYYPEVLDYSAEMYIRTAKTGGGGHPINRIRYMDRSMKGDRKNTKKSLSKDPMVNRTEAYWNEI